MAGPKSYAKFDAETKLESRFSGYPGSVLSIPSCCLWDVGPLSNGIVLEAA